VSLNASNLFDKEYVAGCFSTFGCQYGQQRTVYGTVAYNW
jgi:iron complex outermembrane receptor protein